MYLPFTLPFSVSLCRGQPALPVSTLQRLQDNQCCVGTPGGVCHRRPRERRDQPVQCQGWTHTVRLGTYWDGINCVHVVLAAGFITSKHI